MVKTRFLFFNVSKLALELKRKKRNKNVKKRGEITIKW
jgi:hypothetical protein